MKVKLSVPVEKNSCLRSEYCLDEEFQILHVNTSDEQCNISYVLLTITFSTVKQCIVLEPEPYLFHIVQYK